MSGDRPDPPSPQELTEHLAFVRGVALALVDDPELAEDISQEAILAALRRPPQIERDLRSWLGGVVRNLARVHYREKARRKRRERTVAETRSAEKLGSDTADEALGRAELRQQIAQAVLDLDEPYRTTLILRYMENLSPTQIAAMTDRPVATVKTQLQRGLERLRARFDRENGGRSAWRRAFLGLLLPLPVLLASAGVASAGVASVGVANAGTVGSSMAGNGAATGSTGLATAGAGGAGVLLGSFAWVPIVSIIGVAVWWATTGSAPPSVDPPIRTSTESGDRSGDAPDRSTSSEDLAQLEPEQNLTSESDARTGLPVVVRDEEGRAIAGARIAPFRSAVWVSDPRGDSGSLAPFYAGGEAILTDGEGRATLPEAGTRSIRITHSDFLSRILATGDLVGDPCEVILDRGLLSTIVVIDAITRRPIAGAEVHVEGEEQAIQLGTFLGNFDAGAPLPDLEGRVRDLAAVTITLHEVATEVRGSERSLDEYAAMDSPPAATAVIGVEVQEGALIASFPENSWSANAPRITDARGEVSLRIDPEQTVSLHIVAEGHAGADLPQVDLAAEHPFLVALPAESILSLVRRGPDLPEVRYQLTVGERVLTIELAEGEVEARVDGLPAGVGYLQQRRSSIEWRDPQSADFGSAASLSANPFVQFSTDPPMTSEAPTIGRFLVEYTDRVPRWERPALPVELIAGRETVIDLDAGGAGSITVGIDPIEALASTQLSLRDAAGFEIARANGTETGFEFHHLPEGEFRLALEQGENTLHEEWVTVGGGPRALAWSLPRGSLVVEDLPPCTLITLSHSSGSRVSLASLDGLAVLEYLPRGEARVAIHGAASIELRTVTIDPAREVRLSAGPSTALEVQFTISNGEPGDSAHLSIAPLPVGAAASSLHGLRLAGAFDHQRQAYPSAALSPGQYVVALGGHGAIDQLHTIRVPTSRPIEIRARDTVSVRIRGRHAGIPLERSVIEVESAEPGLRGGWRQRLDARGETELDLPIGRYRVSCSGVEHELSVGFTSRSFELTF